MYPHKMREQNMLKIEKWFSIDSAKMETRTKTKVILCVHLSRTNCGCMNFNPKKRFAYTQKCFALLALQLILLLL